MLRVQINRSTPDCWYHKLEYKNKKAKTFEVIPNADCTKFIISNGDRNFLGKEIDPGHVKDIPAKEVMKLFNKVIG